MARPRMDMLRTSLWLAVGVALFGVGPNVDNAYPQTQATSFADSVAWTCSEGVDRDGDGLTDQCELALAMEFAPELVVADRACNWDGSRLEGGYLFGVDRLPDGEGVRIAYAPAYRQDCGWSGIKCWVRLAGGCRGHAGDSEFLVVDVSLEAEGWRVKGVFMSAHCFGDDGCRWYRGDDLGAIEWARDPRMSGPVVWVAEGKNANYPSRSACDRGHYYYDTCDRNGARYPFPIQDVRNLGSAANPLGSDGCIQWHELDVSPSVDSAPPAMAKDPGLDAVPAQSDGIECFWTDVPFRGWLDTAEEGVTPYVRYLDEIAEWQPGGAS